MTLFWMEIHPTAGKGKLDNHGTGASVPPPSLLLVKVLECFIAGEGVLVMTTCTSPVSCGYSSLHFATLKPGS